MLYAHASAWATAPAVFHAEAVAAAMRQRRLTPLPYPAATTPGRIPRKTGGRRGGARKQPEFRAKHPETTNHTAE
nr:MAG TPA: hypothetical protein [Bacteriophage sp.]